MTLSELATSETGAAAAAELTGLFEGLRHAGRNDAAYCVAHAGAFLLGDAAPPDVRAFAEEYRPKRPRHAAVPLDDAAWLQHLYHPDDDPYVGKVFETVLAAVRRVRAQPLGRFGLTLESATKPSASVALVRALGNAAYALNVPMPLVFLRPQQQGGLGYVGSEPIASVAGAGLLSGRTVDELAFAAGHHMALYRPDHYVRTLCETVGELKSLFLAALKLGKPDLSIPEGVEPVARALAGLVAGDAAAHMMVRKAVALYLDRGVSLDLARWVAGLEATALRAGLLLCGDLGVARRLLATLPSAPANAMADLSTFAMSEDYFALRQMTGIAMWPDDPQHADEAVMPEPTPGAVSTLPPPDDLAVLDAALASIQPDGAWQSIDIPVDFDDGPTEVERGDVAALVAAVDAASAQPSLAPEDDVAGEVTSVERDPVAAVAAARAAEGAEATDAPRSMIAPILPPAPDADATGPTVAALPLAASVVAGEDPSDAAAATFGTAEVAWPFGPTSEAPASDGPLFGPVTSERPPEPVVPADPSERGPSERAPGTPSLEIPAPDVAHASPLARLFAESVGITRSHAVAMVWARRDGAQAPPSVRALLEHHARRAPVPLPGQLSDDEWRDVVTDGGEHTPIGALLLALAGPVRASVARTPEDYGIDRRETHSVHDLLANAVERVGYILAAPPALLIARDDAPALLARPPCEPPVVLFRPGALPGVAPAELLFLAAEYVAYSRHERRTRVLLPTPALIAALVRAVVAAFTTGASAPTGNALVDGVVTALAVDPAALEAARAAVSALSDAGPVEPGVVAWCAATERTAARAALLVAGDLEAAASAMSRDSGAPAMLSPEAKLAMLEEFALSEGYARVRERLGL